MNADWYMERGTTHDVCEDYAVAGQLGDTALAVVSDGCSSSSDVDFGARILAYAARDTLVPVLVESRPWDVNWLSSEIQRKANAVLSCYDLLPSNALDATLLTAVVQPSGAGSLVTACMWGDGLVLVRLGKQIIATMVHYGKNAPHYLVYAMRPERNVEYLKQQSANKQVTEVVFDLEGTELRRRITEEPPGDPSVPLVLKYNAATGDAVVLITDGITQFFTGENSPIAWETLITEFINYKQTSGVFLKRRMNFFQRMNHTEGRTHLDDISAASIIV